jgi:hypothetical protein
MNVKWVLSMSRYGCSPGQASDGTGGAYIYMFPTLRPLWSISSRIVSPSPLRCEKPCLALSWTPSHIQGRNRRTRTSCASMPWTMAIHRYPRPWSDMEPDMGMSNLDWLPKQARQAHLVFNRSAILPGSALMGVITIILR